MYVLCIKMHQMTHHHKTKIYFYNRKKNYNFQTVLLKNVTMTRTAAENNLNIRTKILRRFCKQKSYKYMLSAY